ncbi:MAG: MBL fold metallo-hydrolase [Syntrophorhabdaceae bacterium]
MNIKWYGHSAFLITTSQGTRIITDPYQSGAFGGALAYDKITDASDIVVSTHDHDDHNYTNDIKGTFALVNTEGTHTIKDVTIEGIAAFHDQTKGSERGRNVIYIISADDLRLAHLGDLGHTLDAGTIEKMGKIDVLLIPVGGFYTIDATEASTVMDQLRPSITIPMHFKTEKCDFPITPVDTFTAGKQNVEMAGKTSMEFSKASLPPRPVIIVLHHAL